MSKHANSPFKKLPHEALDNIKGFYSDKYAPHPTAEMIKQLTFVYYPKQLNFVYNPQYIPSAPPIYLCVSWKRMNFFKKFVLSDFTSDRYEEESMKKSNFKIGRPVTLYKKFGYDFKEDIQNHALRFGMSVQTLEHFLDLEK